MLLLALLVVACSDATHPTAAPPLMWAVVNDTSFTSTSSPTDQLGTLDTTKRQLFVATVQTTTPTDYEGIVLTIQNFHGIGRYQTCGTSNTVVGQYYRGNVDSSSRTTFSTGSACSGEVDIDSYFPFTTVVSGTFRFTATSPTSPDTVQVTDGRFSGPIALTGGVMLDPP